MTGARMHNNEDKLTDMHQRRKRTAMGDMGEAVMSCQRRMTGEWNGTSTVLHTRKRGIDHDQPCENIAISSPTPIRERSIMDEVLR